MNVTDTADGAYVVRLERLRELGLAQERYVQLKSILTILHKYTKLLCLHEAGQPIKYPLYDKNGVVLEQKEDGGDGPVMVTGQEALDSVKQHLANVRVEFSARELRIFTDDVTHEEKKSRIDGRDGNRVYEGRSDDMRSFKLTEI